MNSLPIQYLLARRWHCSKVNWLIPSFFVIRLMLKTISPFSYYMYASNRRCLVTFWKFYYIIALFFLFPIHYLQSRWKASNSWKLEFFSIHSNWIYIDPTPRESYQKLSLFLKHSIVGLGVLNTMFSRVFNNIICFPYFLLVLWSIYDCAPC